MHACEQKGERGIAGAHTTIHINACISGGHTPQPAFSLMMNYKAARVVRAFVCRQQKLPAAGCSRATIWMDVFSGHEASRELD